MATESPIDASPTAIRVNKLELLERLADDLAHEIKNPLHSMVINLEVLKRRLQRVEGEGRDDVLRFAGVLGEELERVSRRVDLLLRLSRPGRGAEETTLGELVEELLELVQLEARHRKARVEYRAGEAIARVYVAREPARQAILNLVLDALDRTSSGSTLGIAVTDEEEGAVLAVRSSGAAPGDPSGADAEGSDGRMGVTEALAEALGGRVELRKDGAGTERRLVLPLPRHR